MLPYALLPQANIRKIFSTVLGVSVGVSERYVTDEAVAPAKHKHVTRCRPRHR